MSKKPNMETRATTSLPPPLNSTNPFLGLISSKRGEYTPPPSRSSTPWRKRAIPLEEIRTAEGKTHAPVLGKIQ